MIVLVLKRFIPSEVDIYECIAIFSIIQFKEFYNAVIYKLGEYESVKFILVDSRWLNYAKLNNSRIEYINFML